MKVEVSTSEIPSIFNKFKSEIGEQTWLKRSKSIRNEIKGNKFLKDFLESENEIALSLSKLSDTFNKFRTIPHDLSQLRDCYIAISFAAQGTDKLSSIKP